MAYGKRIHIHVFYCLSPCQEKTSVFLFPIGLCCCHSTREPPSGLQTLFNRDFCSLNFYTSYCDFTFFFFLWEISYQPFCCFFRVNLSYFHTVFKIFLFCFLQFNYFGNLLASLNLFIFVFHQYFKKYHPLSP